MLSYQHIYHAGNAADVQKHLWLVRVLQGLLKSSTPIVWLDTHGGRGLYDLSAPEAQKLGEYQDGFLKFRQENAQSQSLPPAERAYLDLVRQTSTRRKVYYPGSALIAAKMLRPQDQLEVCELHKGEIEHLKSALAPFPQATVEKINGYDKLASLKVNKTMRGGVLIDPSYEIKSEYIDVFNAVGSLLEKWPQAHILIWYPLLPAAHHTKMITSFQELKETGLPLLIDEITWHDPKDGQRGMYGSGMVIVNANV